MVLAVGMAGQSAPFAADVQVQGPIVRLADVADLTALPPVLRERAEAIEVHRAPPGASVLSSRRAAARARAAVPALTTWFPDHQDRSIRVTATVSSPSGTVTIPKRSAGPEIAVGAPVTVAVRVGPVVVERQATALQEGWPGRRFFVRTADGEVLTARLEDEQ